MVYHTDTFGFVVSQGVMVEAYTTHLVTKEREKGSRLGLQSLILGNIPRA